MKKRIFFTCSFVLAFTCGTAYAQLITVVQTLTIPKSVAANGMGGIASCILSNDPVAVMDNPGQLGAFSLNNFFSASTYTPRTDWFPSSFPTVYTLNSNAFNAGMEISQYLHLPFKAGIGIGYSDYRFSGGAADQRSNDVTIGLGIDYFVRFGFGYTFMSLNSSFLGTNTQNPSLPPVLYNAKPAAHSIGGILEIPVVGIISKLDNRSVQIGDGIRPMFDITVGASGRNIGNEVRYSNLNEALPLPRQSVLGWSLRGGVETRENGRSWQLLTFTWAREANDPLVTQEVTMTGTTPVYSFGGYEKGFGTTQPFESLVLGKTNSQITLGKGWEIDALDLLYLRGGSDTGPGVVFYSTSGWSLRLDGLMRLLSVGRIIPRETPVLGFVMNHLDLEYSFAKYYSTPNSEINGVKFSDLTLVVK